MKAAVIGNGNVGMAVFNEPLNLGGIDELAQIVRDSAAGLILGKGSTAYGVAAAARRIVAAVAGDTHEILPVSVLLDGEYGQRGVAVSVPCVLGREGVLSVKRMNLTEEERKAFENSCAVLADTAARIGR